MAWNAKPSEGYAVNSAEWQENLTEIYNQLGNEWTIEAVSGMCGNMQSESGLNPWRWQSDVVDLKSDTHGYGLPQFTPAYGYINDYGYGLEGYGPNLSVAHVTSGALPTDGHAQIICINEDRAHKFLNRSSYCDYADIRAYYPLSAFKQGTDLWLATVAWLFHYEFPASQYRTESAARARYANTQAVYNFLSGQTPPEPPGPPGPSPREKRAKMPIYMYPSFRERRMNLWL